MQKTYILYTKYVKRTVTKIFSNCANKQYLMLNINNAMHSTSVVSQNSTKVLKMRYNPCWHNHKHILVYSWWMEPRDAVTHCTVFETEACFNPMFMGAILLNWHLTVSQLYPKDRVMVGSVYSFYCYLSKAWPSGQRAFVWRVGSAGLWFYPWPGRSFTSNPIEWMSL